MFFGTWAGTFCGVSLDRIYGCIGSFTAKSRMREIMDSFVKRSVSSSGEVILSFFVFRYVSKRFCTLRMRPETSGMMIFFPVICSIRMRIRTGRKNIP